MANATTGSAPALSARDARRYLPPAILTYTHARRCAHSSSIRSTSFDAAALTTTQPPPANNPPNPILYPPYTTDLTEKWERYIDLMTEKSGELPSIEHRPTKEQIEKSIEYSYTLITLYILNGEGPQK